jgi:hypothetical protein
MKSIPCWAAGARKGRPFVFVLDNSGGLWWSRLPEARFVTVRRIKAEVIAMHCSPHRDAVVLVTSDGNVLLVPFPFA